MISIQDLKNKKIAVLGLGEENLTLTNFLIKNNIRPTICDQKSREELGEYYDKLKDMIQIEWRLGTNYLDDLQNFDIIFRSPGLPYLNPKIQESLKTGVEISSEIKLFFDLCPCPIIGVTGTKGKGTTSSLIYEILKRELEMRNEKCGVHGVPHITSHISNLHLSSQIYLGGNIGIPPISFLDKLIKDDIVVLELSSFQLQDMEKSPHIAVVLDIKVDHLDYHEDEKEYVAAKTNIVKYQKKDDFAVVNADYLTSVEFATSTPAETYWFSRRKSIDQGVWVNNQKEIILKDNDKETIICKTDELMLKGKHNWENICAAITASYLTGVGLDTIRETVKQFKGLEHRLEFVRVLNGVNYYNDSFSTTPDTTIAAIKSFSEPIILLLGGSEKNADYKELGKIINSSSVKEIISMGGTAKKIIDLIKRPSINIIKDIQTMEEAVSIAMKSAKPGDIVLLSPASASFDRYDNYKQRGELFKKAVLKLQ